MKAHINKVIIWLYFHKKNIFFCYFHLICISAREKNDGTFANANYFIYVLLPCRIASISFSNVESTFITLRLHYWTRLNRLLGWSVMYIWMITGWLILKLALITAGLEMHVFFHKWVFSWFYFADICSIARLPELRPSCWTEKTRR